MIQGDNHLKPRIQCWRERRLMTKVMKVVIRLKIFPSFNIYETLCGKQPALEHGVFVPVDHTNV